MKREDEQINVWGARVHNLKNVDVTIPRNSLTVITGLSGSGKSSLAFDTIFAEGQRRYIETFSAYARNFLGSIDRPDVDKITGLSPVISIEQKTTNKNPRSTVGTTTEIYDYLRLLYARAGTAYSYLSGEKMVRYTEEKVIGMILDAYADRRIYILAPLVRQRKGHYRELFESMRRKGYLYMRVDGEIVEIVRGMKVDRYKNHNIEVVIDRFKVQGKEDERLKKSVQMAMKQGDGTLMIMDYDTKEVRNYSKRLMDPVTGISYGEAAPNIFSFNSPEGAWRIVIRCSRDDFDIAMAIGDVLIYHTVYCYAHLPQSKVTTNGQGEIITKKSKMEQLLAALPNKFDRETYRAVSMKHGYPVSTTAKWINDYVRQGRLEHSSQNCYRKL